MVDVIDRAQAFLSIISEAPQAIKDQDIEINELRQSINAAEDALAAEEVKVLEASDLTGKNKEERDQKRNAALAASPSLASIRKMIVDLESQKAMVEAQRDSIRRQFNGVVAASPIVAGLIPLASFNLLMNDDSPSPQLASDSAPAQIEETADTVI